VFDRSHVLAGSPEDALAVLLAGSLVFSLLQVRRHHDEPGTAAVWWRAGAYYSGCLLVGWATGVLSRLVRTHVVADGQLGDRSWWLATAAVFAIVAFGYAGIWRAGTQHHGRVRHVPSVLAFGIAWGVSEGVLMLAFFSLGELFGFAKLGASVTAVLAASVWLGGWHATYWDKYVAPEHNIASWNLPKVLLAHTPNLIVSTWYFATNGNTVIFISAQVLALTISTWFMRFPPYTTSATEQLVVA